MVFQYFQLSLFFVLKPYVHSMHSTSKNLLKEEQHKSCFEFQTISAPHVELRH